MIVELHDRAPARPAATLACTPDAVWLWPGIPLTHRHGGSIVARRPDAIIGLAAKLHGPAAAHSAVVQAVERAALHLTSGDVQRAERALARADLPPITPDGHLLVRRVAALLGRLVPDFPVGSFPRLWTGTDIEFFARRHAVQAIGHWEGITKAGFNPDEPRDRDGRWTTGANNSSAPATRKPVRDVQDPPDRGSLRHGPRGLVAPPRRPRFPGILPAAAEEDDEEGARRGLLGEMFDATAELRAELYRMYIDQIRRIDPDNQELFSLTSPDWVPSWPDVNRASYALDVARWTKEAENGALDMPPTEWERGWAARGRNIHVIRGETLPPNHPVIDDFTNGVARSIKSIDLNAPSYQDPAPLEGRIDSYVNDLARYNGSNWAGYRITPDKIESRMLDLVIPRGSGTEVQREAIRRAQLRAWSLGIAIDVTEY